MQFLKTLFWVVVAIALTLFASYKWRPVTLNLWSGLQADVTGHSHATRAMAQTPHGVQGARIIGAINARLNNNNAVESQRPLQFDELAGGRVRRCVGPLVDKGEFGCVENMHMAIT